MENDEYVWIEDHPTEAGWYAVRRDGGKYPLLPEMKWVGYWWPNEKDESTFEDELCVFNYSGGCKLSKLTGFGGTYFWAGPYPIPPIKFTV